MHKIDIGNQLAQFKFYVFVFKFFFNFFMCL